MPIGIPGSPYPDLPGFSGGLLCVRHNRLRTFVPGTGGNAGVLRVLWAVCGHFDAHFGRFLAKLGIEAVDHTVLGFPGSVICMLLLSTAIENSMMAF